jgi:hypothetical protein
MMRVYRPAAFAALVAMSCSVAAAPKMALYPIQAGAETVHFQQGVPTLNFETPTGAVQITPLPLDHGSMSFAIAVYNKGTMPANIGVENITVTTGGQTLAVFTREQLESKAKTRAMWSQIAVAAIAGAAAAAASTASTTQTYHSRTYTPWGAVSHVSTYRDNSIGVVGAGVAAGAGVAGIVGIQNRLDYTLANLGDEIVQTTTVDADASYGGRIVIDKLKKVPLPADVQIKIAFNGETYPFNFRATPAGKNMPAPFTTQALTPSTATQPTPAAPVAEPDKAGHTAV